ncbi:cation channel family protein [Histomonas meleagridis]|uniref:cation channel family protein n=1 Tax=Histomonas meleagridis TaxID=135588 RepID=UPI00355A4579|nr:cation channel family protein [Histomonas meleagridis]KAH0796370.1 cation channel family protein [Histomonas meleagridis]
MKSGDSRSFIDSTAPEKIFTPSSNYDEIEPGCHWAHFSVTRRIWEYVIFFASMITPIEMSYVLVFDQHISVESYSIFFLIDIIQLIDNFVILKTPFLRRGILITSTKEILKNYGIFYYVLHVFASLPLGWIGLIKEDVTLYVVLSINRLLRLHQAWNSYKLIQYSTLYNGPIFNLFPYFTLYVFIVHAFACIYYLLATHTSSPTSWISGFLDQGFSNFQLYVTSLYFVVTTILTIGYGDIHPTNTNEYVVAIIIQIVGVVFESSIVAKMISSISDPEGNKFLVRYDHMQKYMHGKNVERGYLKHVRHYCQGMWEKYHGAPEWNTLFKEIPESLRCAIVMELCRNVIEEVDIFKGFQEHHLLMLMDQLTTITFVPDEIIYRQGDLFSDLLIINSGTVKIVIDDVVVGTQTAKKGFVDGERELFFNEPRDKTLIAASFIEGWRLKRRKFSRMIHESQEVQSIVFNNARKKYPDNFNRTNVHAGFFVDDEDDPYNSEVSESDDSFSSNSFSDFDFGT